MSDLGLPYGVDSRQVQGRKTEKKVLRSIGARQHPMSGAGRIKEDGSDDDHLYEIKDANLVFGLKGSELAQSFIRAVRQGKTAVWIVQFSNGYEAVIEVRRKG